MLPSMRNKECQEHLPHQFTLIEIHAYVAISLGQRQQAGGGGQSLLPFSCLVQSYDLQRKHLDRHIDIPWPIKKLSEALQDVERLGGLMQREIHPHQHQHCPFLVGVPCFRGEQHLLREGPCRLQITGSEPVLHACHLHRYRAERKALLLHQYFCQVHFLACGSQITSCKTDPRHIEMARCQQIDLLPVLSDAQRLLERASRLFQTIPGVVGVEQEEVQITCPCSMTTNVFHQGKPCQAFSL